MYGDSIGHCFWAGMVAKTILDIRSQVETIKKFYSLNISKYKHVMVLLHSF